MLVCLFVFQRALCCFLEKRLKMGQSETRETSEQALVLIQEKIYTLGRNMLCIFIRDDDVDWRGQEIEADPGLEH